MDSDGRMAELILYVSDRCQADPAYGATKLNKILFYADFQHYAKHGKSITGQEYMRLGKGPVPRHLVPVLNRLVQEHHLVVREAPYGASRQKRPIALRSADVSGFNGEEIATVDSVIARFWGMSATEVSEKSHEFNGWKLAPNRETIPYDMALLVDCEPSREDHAFALELGREYAAARA